MATTIYDNEETGLMATQYAGPGRQLMLALDGVSNPADGQVSFTPEQAIEAAKVLVQWARQQGAGIAPVGSEGWRRCADPHGGVAACHEGKGAFLAARRSDVDGTIRLFVGALGGGSFYGDVPEGLVLELFSELDGPED